MKAVIEFKIGQGGTNQMYAVIVSGGKQYKVTEGLIFETELLNAEDSDPVAVATEILNDLDTGDGEGIYTVEDLPVVLVAFAENVVELKLRNNNVIEEIEIDKETIKKLSR